MRLYLVRHGQTAWNRDLKAQGHCDTPLDENGLQQAQLLGEHFRDIRLSAIYTSDLCRASATAEAVAGATGAVLNATPVLRERSFGSLEGLPFDKVTYRMRKMQEEQQLVGHEVRPPEGESLADVWHRVLPLVKEILAAKDPVAVVSHGATCGLILAQLIHANIESARAFRFANASVTELHRRGDGSYFITRYNDTEHLGSLIALQGSSDGVVR